MVLMIHLMRHVEPQGCARYLGQLDDPLSALGWQQMCAVKMNTLPLPQVISSSLSRCAGFAKELADSHSIPLMLDAQFNEIDFGDWEG